MPSEAGVGGGSCISKCRRLCFLACSAECLLLAFLQIIEYLLAPSFSLLDIQSCTQTVLFLFFRFDNSFCMHCIASKMMILFSSVRKITWFSMFTSFSISKELCYRHLTHTEETADRRYPRRERTPRTIPGAILYQAVSKPGNSCSLDDSITMEEALSGADKVQWQKAIKWTLWRRIRLFYFGNWFSY